MNTTITPSHLADYLTFNFRRSIAAMDYDGDGTMHDQRAVDAIKWRELSTVLLAPIWRELDQYALDYVKQQWDSFEYDHAAHLLHLIRDADGQSDAALATAEVQSMARNFKLVHRWREDGAIEVDTVSVLLHRFGLVDPRLELDAGACVSDCRSNAHAVA